jgi:enoyl-CoA hydratase/carnithine racemase
MSDMLRVEYHGRVAEVIIDRPPVNAVAVDLYSALISVFRSFAKQDDVHAVILRSANDRIFCAGADLKEILPDNVSFEASDEYRQRLARTCYDAVLDCALPTIAVVKGLALGAGAVLAACCDIRFAGESAQLGLPEITVGRCGGGRHLMRLVPQGTVRLMYFTGEPIDAVEAQRVGLVERVYADGAVLQEARTLAEKIACKSPLGLRLAKRALNEAEDMPVRAGYAHEQQYTLRLGRTADAKEAASAVMEKREPVWSWRMSDHDSSEHV